MFFTFTTVRVKLQTFPCFPSRQENPGKIFQHLTCQQDDTLVSFTGGVFEFLQGEHNLFYWGLVVVGGLLVDLFDLLFLDKLSEFFPRPPPPVDFFTLVVLLPPRSRLEQNDCTTTNDIY